MRGLNLSRIFVTLNAREMIILVCHSNYGTDFVLSLENPVEIADDIYE